ncbi:MAG: glycosyltransferase [Solirubrobacterales bacterium]|nr:glycosyltransferase [Solirubrobacterales bacterium]
MSTSSLDMDTRQRSWRSTRLNAPELVAPAMVCALDVHEPFVDMQLPQSRDGGPYRSLFVLATFEGRPVGTAVISTEGESEIPRARVATEVRRQLHRQLTRAIARRTRQRGGHRPLTARRSVSVIVTTCGDPLRLERCLASVLACDHDDFEVIVVENRPEFPGTRQMLVQRFAGDARVRYVEERQRGLSSARNAGLAVAKNELVAFVDDDVVVDRGWLSRAAAAFDRSDDIACVTGLILPLELESESQLLLERFMTLGKGFAPRIFRLPESWQEFPLLPYTPGLVGSGANTFLRVDVAEQLGGFDVTLGTGTPACGGEDLDLYIRLLREGHAIAYEPGAIVWHPHPSEPRQLRRQVYRYGVGLGATLTKQLVAGPDRRQFLRAVPAGIAYARDPASRKNAGTSAGYPRRLRWLERVGMLVGPAAYIGSALRRPGRGRARVDAPARRQTADGRRELYLRRLTLSRDGAVQVVEIAPARVATPRRPPARRRRAGPAPRREPSVERAALTYLFLFSLAVFAGARAMGVGELALGAEFGVLFFGVGAAPMQLSGAADLSVRLGVAGLVGLATALLAGAVLVLGPSWQPEFAAALVLAAAGVVHALAWPSAMGDLRLWTSRRRRRHSLRRPQVMPVSYSLVLTLVGTSLWLGSAVATGHVVPGVGGFLTQITPLWYAGVVLVLAAITLAWREPHERYAVLAVGSLVLALTLTPALVYGMPRSQSAGKHIELVQTILSTHHLHAGSGIYFAYSGFFAAVAWLCRLAGVSDSLGVATFWPVLMGLVRLAELRFLFGQVLEGRHRRWAAITLVVLVDAISADYFSPQAVGYVVGLGVYGLVLSSRQVLSSRFVVALLIVAGCALAPTHELSPYIIGGVLIVLAVFGCGRPRWAGLAILIPAGAWALIHRGELGGYLSLSNLFDPSNFAPPHTSTAPGVSRLPIVGYSSHALALGLLVLSGCALVGFVRHRHERWAWAYLLSAGVGGVLLVANPYGNEGIFRWSLFGIPWLALLAVHAVERPSPLVRYGAWTAVTAGLLATFLVAAFGMDGSAVMRRSDLDAWRTFARTAPANADLLSVGFGDLPGDVPQTGPHRTQITYETLADAASQRPGRPTPGDLDALLRRYQSFVGRTGGLYAIWSPVLSTYGREYGLERPSQSRRWLELLMASPSWRLVFERGGSYVFRAVPRR